MVIAVGYWDSRRKAKGLVDEIRRDYEEFIDKFEDDPDLSYTSHVNTLHQTLEEKKDKGYEYYLFLKDEKRELIEEIYLVLKSERDLEKAQNLLEEL